METLVAVVVSFNRLSKLQVTVDLLLACSPDILSQIVIFDNASTDGTEHWLKTLTDPRVAVVTSPKNVGGAGGFELAMREATKRFDPDWIVLMDDDARPLPGSLETFHAKKRQTHSVWAAAVTYPSGRICDMNRPWINPFGSFRDLWRTILQGRESFHLGTGDYESSAVRDIDGASFVGLFLSKRAIASAGYPDGRMFLYGDDVLYSFALRKAGSKIGFDPGLRFEHDCETLNETGPRVITPTWKVYYFYRNQILIAREAAGSILFWPVSAIRLLSWYSSARHYGPERQRYLRLLRFAVKDGLQHRLDRSHETLLESFAGERPSTGSSTKHKSSS